MNCRKQYAWRSLRGKLAEVKLFKAFVCSRCCRNKHPITPYCRLLWELVGIYVGYSIGAGSSPIGCEGFVKARKVQGSSLLLSSANNFVGHSYIINMIYYNILIYCIHIHVIFSYITGQVLSLSFLLVGLPALSGELGPWDSPKLVLAFWFHPTYG